MKKNIFLVILAISLFGAVFFGQNNLSANSNPSCIGDCAADWQDCNTNCAGDLQCMQRCTNAHSRCMARCK